MARNIRGNRDGANGGNDSYTVHGRGVVDRQTLVKEVKAGQHPHHHVLTVEGEEYVRDNPDSSTTDNNNR